MYAKLTNNHLNPAPKRINHNGSIVINPKSDKLLELGYLPVTYTDMPQAPEGQHYESGWTQTADAIIQTWTLADDPVYPEPEPTVSDLIDAINRGLTL